MTNLSLRSDADHINEYLMGREAQLTAALEEKLKRLQIVADLLAKHGQRIVVTKLMRLWPTECSQATAYRLIEEAQDVFTPKVLHERGFYVDNLLNDVRQTRAMAVAALDLKTMAACDKNIATIIEKFMGTNEALPIDKLQPPRMLFAFTPELAGQPLPDNWQAEVERLKKKRKTVGVVANHEDFTDAHIVDESNTRSAPPAAAISTSEN